LLNTVKIVIAPDSFKGSLSAVAAAAAMAAGAREVFPGAEIVELPVGDGGEGTVEAMVRATGGQRVGVRVTGPLGEPVEAAYGLLGDGRTAVVEMAAASGLGLVPPERRDARRTTSIGTGELIRAALAAGAERLIIGIGGSATNDAGAGAMTALGARFLDAKGAELPPGGAALAQLEHIDLSHFQRPPVGTEVVIASDVTNPLCGPTGASAIYGPQKGAGPEDVAALDAALERWAAIVARDVGAAVRDLPGAGAAGGLGAALRAFLGARMERGVELVLDAVGFDRYLEGADLVLTGEGKIDAQTAFGKTIAGVGARCRARKVPALAFAGWLGDDLPDLREIGIAGMACLLPRPMSLEEAMRDAAALLRSAVTRTLRIYEAGQSARGK
jgi:glycerate 2-kinase